MWEFPFLANHFTDTATGSGLIGSAFLNTDASFRLHPRSSVEPRPHAIPLPNTRKRELHQHVASQLHHCMMCRKAMQHISNFTLAEEEQVMNIHIQSKGLATRKDLPRACRTVRFKSYLFDRVAIMITAAALSCSANAIGQSVDSTATNTAYGYYYKGKMVVMNQSTTLIAVESNETSFAANAKAYGLQRNPLSDHKALKQRGIGVYNRIPSKTKASPQTNIHALIKDLMQTTRVVQPVFEQGEALLIPTDEIIVGFKQPTSLEEAKRYLDQQAKSQGIINVAVHRRNAFIVKINHPTNGRSFAVCQILVQLEKIRFAEPNQVMILLHNAPPMVPSDALAPPASQTNATVPLQPDNKDTNDVSDEPIQALSAVGWTTLIDEGFEGGLPSGWSTNRWSSSYSPAYWGGTTYRSHTGSGSLYASGGGPAGTPAPGPYTNSIYSCLDTPVLNLAPYEETYIEVWFYAKYQDPLYDPYYGTTVYDFGKVGIYNPSTSGTSWLGYLAVAYTGDLTADPTTDNGWRRALFRVPPSLHLNGIQVRFAFCSDSSTSAEGLYIDDVRIVGTADEDTEPLGNDTYGARHWDLKNAGQIAGLGNDDNDMHVPEAWDGVSLAPDIVVAIIDCGVDLSHPDLNLIKGYDYTGAGDGGPLSSDDNHGTACAGETGAIRNNGIGVIGTAPGVRIMPIYEGSSWPSSFASSIDVAVEKGARILSNSWGVNGGASTDLEDAIDDALAANRIVLFAAGNGPDRPPWSYDVAFPGILTGSKDIICVGASSPTDEHKSAASSDGEFGWGSSYVGNGPDVSACSTWSYTTDRQGSAGYNSGGAIETGDNGDYDPAFTGTSAATPKAAGIVALVLSKNPYLTPGMVKTILRNTADDIETPGVDDKTGAGRINAYAALNSITALATDPPAGFSASAVGGSRVDLAWTPNTDTDDVMIAFDTDDIFAMPATGTTYSPGDHIGTATVLYVGAGTTLQHTNLVQGSHYYYRAWSVDTSANYSLPAYTNAKTLVTLPHTESFESGFGVWVNAEGDDGDWTRYTGPTPSSSTGPAGASDGSYYLYTEATSGANPGFPDKTALLDATFDFSTAAWPVLTFDYHMYGAAMGSLYVDIYDGTWHTNEWSRTGQQQTSLSDPWAQAVIDLTDYAYQSGVTVRFRGVTGSSYTSDMAIDHITLFDNAPYLDHFTWSSIPSPQQAGVGFTAEVTARDQFDNLFDTFTGTVDLSAVANADQTGEISIGDGTTGWYYPMATLYHDARSQVIYLDSDIGSACTLTSLALNVSTLPGQMLGNWTIRMRHTSLDSYSAVPAWESSWTTVYQHNTTISSLGWNVFEFDTPFEYNGTDNLMVDFSYNNSSWTSYGYCVATDTGASRSLCYRTDSVYGDPLTWSGTSSPTPTVSSYIPNIRLGTSGHPVPIAVIPARSANFAAGTWSGTLTIPVAATSVVLQANDGAGHMGTSGGFDVTSSAGDADTDGIPDWWEALYFGHPSNCVWNADDDFDGQNNRAEYIAGMCPTNPASCFMITNCIPMAPGLIIEWPSVSGRVYSTLWSPTLTNSFQFMETNINYPRHSSTDTTHAAEDAGFYKVEVHMQ